MNQIIGRLAASVVAGLLIALAFPPTGIWPLAIVGVAAFSLVVAGQRVRWALLYGFVAGFSTFAVLVRWLSVVGTDAWLALAAFSAGSLAVCGAATALVIRGRLWPWSVGLVWVAQEAVRDRIPLGGWPWGRLAFSQSEAPWLPIANLGGTVALTFAVATSGGWLAWAAINRRDVVPAGITLVALVCAPWLAGLWPLPAAGQGSTGQPSSAVVAVVQGDVPATGLGFANAGQRREVLDNHVRQTLALAGEVAAGRTPQPDAVIWPENASDLDPYTQPDARSAITAAARAVQAPILVGAVITNRADPTTVLNVGIVWVPQEGPTDQYIKQHPVPFGEYVPFRDLLADRIDRFALIERDFAAGDSNGVLAVGPVVLGDVICFEVAYDELVRDTVLAGARMLAVQTNNATYTGTGQSEQQLAMARIRAVEHGRSVVVAATNGISAMMLPDGVTVGQLAESTSGWLVEELPLRDDFSIADRTGWWPELIAWTLATLITVRGLFRPVRVWRSDTRESGEVIRRVDMEG